MKNIPDYAQKKVFSLTEVIYLLGKSGLKTSRRNLIRHLEKGYLKGEMISSGWIVYSSDLIKYMHRRKGFVVYDKVEK